MSCRFLLSLCLCLFFRCAAGSVLAASELQPATLYSLVNLTRTTRGLNSLTTNAQLEQAAQLKAADLDQTQTFSHVVNDRQPWYYLDLVGYTYLVAAENLAQNFKSETDVVEAWLDSPPHAQNLLSPQYTHTGIAVRATSQGNLVVQLLAAPITAPLPSHVTSQYHQTSPVTPSISVLPILGILILTVILVLVKRLRFRPPVPPASLWKN